MEKPSVNNIWNVLVVGGVILVLLIMFTSSIGYSDYTTEKTDTESMDYINEIRISNNLTEIEFDERVYDLAVFKARQMIADEYYEHRNPHTDECIKDIKAQHGFEAHEHLAENLEGYEVIDYTNTRINWDAGNITIVVDSWMNSEGHRTNLLYPDHSAGAVACELDKCVFLGLNNKGYGSICK